MYKAKIKELADACMRAQNLGQAIRDRIEKDGGDISAEDQEQLDRYAGEFSDNHAKMSKYEERQAAWEKQQGIVATLTEPGDGGGKAGDPKDLGAEDGLPSDLTFAKVLSAHERYIRGDRLSADEHGMYIRPWTDPQKEHPQIEAAASLDPDVLTKGGFLVPEVVLPELVKLLSRGAAMRPICRVVQTSSDNVILNTLTPGANPYTSGIIGTFRRPSDRRASYNNQQNQPRFGHRRIPVSTWDPEPITILEEQLEDSRINLTMEVINLLAEVKVHDEDAAFTIGSGEAGTPEGIMNGGISVGHTAPQVSNTANISYKDFVDLWASLHVQYATHPSTRWMMNRKTYAHLIALRDDDGRPIFGPDMLKGSFLEVPIVFNEWMDDIGSSNDPVLLGAFVYYAIVDRVELQTRMLDQVNAPDLTIVARARFGGQLLRPEPFRILRTA